jgi:hypothetical protein
MKHLLDDSCGCATSALFMVAGLLGASLHYGLQFHANGLALAPVALRIVLVTFVAAGTGKVVGLLRHRLRHTRRTFPTRSPPAPQGD